MQNIINAWWQVNYWVMSHLELDFIVLIVALQVLVAVRFYQDDDSVEGE